jgi:predicted small lipoprotein YifL
MKKLLAIVMTLAMVLSLAACGGSSEPVDNNVDNTPAETTKAASNDAADETTKAADTSMDMKKWEGETLVIHSFTNELEHAAAYFEEEYGATVEYTIIPTADYPQTVLPTLETGVGAPDVYVAEAAFIKDFVNNGFWENLSQAPYNASDLEGQVTQYVLDTGKDWDGNIRALSWQMTPGGLFYRRSVALEVFGTDDPDEIGAKLSSKEMLFDTARTLKDAGYRLFPDEGAMRHFTNPNQDPWVDENNNLLWTQDRQDHFEYAKTLRDEELTALAGEWSPAWFAGMYGPIQVGESGAETTVFSYALPTWGLHYVLKTSTPEEGGGDNPTWGDWAVTSGPNPYYWGGTWVGIYNGSTQKEMAWDFVQLLGTPNEYLADWLAESGDVSGIYDMQIKEASEEFLGGQNHQEYFQAAGADINGKMFTKYDQNLNELYNNAVNDYLNGVSSKEDAMAAFLDSVKAAYPEINVQ